MAVQITMTDAEYAEFQKKAASSKVSKAATGKAQVAQSQALVFPKGISETDTEYLIHVPKSTPSHVSTSGKSRVINVDHLLPKGTAGAVGFIGGRLFFPL